MLEPDGKGSHWFRVDPDLREVAGINEGDPVTVAVEPSKEWPEPELPVDLSRALAYDSKANALWLQITPMARWDWLRWIRATNNQETRSRRIEVAVSKLKAGERRPCCFNRNLCTEPEVSKNACSSIQRTQQSKDVWQIIKVRKEGGELNMKASTNSSPEEKSPSEQIDRMLRIRDIIQEQSDWRGQKLSQLTVAPPGPYFIPASLLVVNSLVALFPDESFVSRSLHYPHSRFEISCSSSQSTISTISAPYSQINYSCRVLNKLHDESHTDIG